MSLWILNEAKKNTEITTKNIVYNGNFSDETPWLSKNASCTIADNTLIAYTDERPSSVYGYLENPAPTKIRSDAGDIVYASCYSFINDVSNVKKMGFSPDDSSWRNIFGGFDLTENEWVRQSGTLKYPNNSDRDIIKFELIGVSGTPTTIKVKHNLTINLTKTFGENNEPTTKQMDALLKQFPDNWFDGTKNLFNAQHFMKMYFDKMTELDNAITALGGGDV